ncbi:hypothetical protein BJX99DRAFT_256340 [Aspergillus californicus]
MSSSKPPTETEPPFRIPCSYRSCKFEFKTINEMKRHKNTYPDHEYCPKCDEDYDTEEQLLIHMIKSDKHIVCPICGNEFRSEGGRDGHIRQNHRTAQNLICHGCKATFRSAASYMRHIENDECPVIRSDRLLVEQQKKLMIKEALGISTTPTAPTETETVDGDGDGGVSIYKLADYNREAMGNQPTYGEDLLTPVPGELVEKHWPALAKTGSGSETGLEGAMSDLMGFSESSASDDRSKENAGWKGKGGLPSVVGSKISYTTMSETGPKSPATVVNLGDELRKVYKTWDPENFFDGFSGQYVCACGKSCATLPEFEKHVLYKSKGTLRLQCPGCLRIFKSTAAMIAHCESATTRCNVHEGNSFAQIMDEISGGMIQMAGYNEDGTMKYEAANIDVQKKTTIGVDLDKVGW